MNEKSEPVAPQGLQEAPTSFASAAPVPPSDPVSASGVEELRGQDLRRTDLTKYKGLLLPEHLAGSDLTGNQTVPEEIKKFPALEQVKAISGEARKVFIGLLAACVYSWLVIGKTHDVDLILNTAGSPLPIINTPIPTAGFYVVGAAILAAVYCYLHFYLQRLWRTLATLPAMFPDGVALDDKTDPWLLTNLVRTEFTLLRPTAPPLARLENLLAVFLTWWLVPLTLLALWARSLPAHGWLGTSWLVFLIGLATLFGQHTYRLARTALQGRTSLTAEQTGADGGVLLRAWHELRGLRLDKLTGWLTVGLVVCSISAFRDDPQAPYTWVAKGLNKLNFIGIRTYADLSEVEVAQPPEGWDGKDWSKVKRIDLRGRNLAFADAGRSFLANADFRNAQLQGANLVEAQLQGANLSDAQLQRANLRDAQLQSADLGHVQLQDATLVTAQLQGANLESAEIERANLLQADLQGANLKYANLQSAALDGANLRGADLTSARLQASSAIRAGLEGAELEDAQLEGADLRAAHFQGADLRGAHLQGADLRFAALWRALVDPSDASWKLADLRNISVEPMADVDALITVVSESITDERQRTAVTERLTKSLATDARPARPEFPVAWLSRPNVMFRLCGGAPRDRAKICDPKPLPLRWGPREWNTIEAYDQRLAELLGDLACSSKVPNAAAPGLANRAIFTVLFRQERSWPALFAKRLVRPDCASAKDLDELTRLNLQRLAAP
jgi:uncharacterized protein YjbI with pentapeptide repeats